MTTAAPFPVSGRVRQLHPGEEHLLAPLFAADPVTHCFPAARVAEGGLRSDALGGYMLGYERAGVLTSALLVGANLVPIATDADARAEFAGAVIRKGRRSSSIVGPSAEVLDLWAHLRPYWGSARDVRPDQPLMVATGASRVPADPQVRRVRASELDALFPACVAMFTEEVGVSPLAGGTGPAYRRRVLELIERGRALARFEGRRPVFKAEIGAVTDRCCQIQGVWVDPPLRGRGLATAGMASVVAFAQQESETVSLYVNSYNTPARRAYESAGFTTISTFATVLF